MLTFRKILSSWKRGRPATVRENRIFPEKITLCYTKEKAHAHIQRIQKGGGFFQGPDLYIIKNDETVSDVLWKPDHLPDVDFTSYEMSSNALLIGEKMSMDGIRKTFERLHKTTITQVAEVRNDLWHVLE